MSQNAEAYDYIIVGAGQRRLRPRQPADGIRTASRVAAGGGSAQHRTPWLHIPLGYGKLFTDRRFNWCYQTEPQPECHGRNVIAPRGKVLGGSSSINGLIYIRGQAERLRSLAPARQCRLELR